MRFLYISCDDTIIGFNEKLTMEESYCDTCDLYYTYLGQRSEEIISIADELRHNLIEYHLEHDIKLDSYDEFIYQFVKLLDYEEEKIEQERIGLQRAK